MLSFRRTLVSATNAAVRLAGRVRKPGSPLREFRNFLLMEHHIALGPTVLGTPILRVLHTLLPGTRIIAVASGSSLDLLSCNPAVEKLIASPDPRRDFAGTVRTLRRAHLFDGEPFLSLLTIGNSRPDVRLAAMLGGASQCLSFAVQSDGPTSLVYDRLLSRIGNDMRFLDVLGHGEAFAHAVRQQPELMEPQVFFSAEHLSAAQALLREHGIGPGAPFAVFVTQSRPIPVRLWPPERFQAVASWVHRELRLPIVFVGVRAEAAAIDALRAPLDFPTANLAGRTNLLELTALLSLASIGLTQDSGTMHLCRAVQLPMVILGPAAGAPVEWLPLGNPRVRILMHAYAPPGLGYPVPGELSAETVQEKLLELFTLYGPR